MLGSVEQTQPFKNIKGELYLDYYPVIYSKGRSHITKEYSPSSDWVMTRGICQSDLGKAKPIPIVRRDSPNEGSSGSLTQNRGVRTFTTMNSDTRPLRDGDEGISMGSKISNERQKPGFGTKKSQQTNLTTETNGRGKGKGIIKENTRMNRINNRRLNSNIRKKSSSEEEVKEVKKEEPKAPTRRNRQRRNRSNRRMKSPESEQETKPAPVPKKEVKKDSPKKRKAPVRRIGRREFVEESSDSDSYG
jgi:hypothetical protein